MSKRSTKLNYFYNLIYQIFSILTPLITAPYVSRVLGSVGVGRYSYTYSIASYFVLFGALGFGYYAQREVARYQNNKYEQSKIFWEILVDKFFSTLISLLIYFILIFVGIYGESYSILMTILAINVGSTAFDITFFFQGNEEFGLIAFRNIAIRLLFIIMIFVFVKSYDDLWLYVLFQTLSVLLSAITLFPALKKRLVKVKLKELNFRRHVKPTFRLFLPTIAVSVYTMLDKTLIGILVQGSNSLGQNYSDIENGNYEQAEKIVKLVLTLLTSLGAVMLPRNSQAIADGNFDEFKRNINGVINFVFFLGCPLMFGLAAISFNFSPWFFGPGYDKVPLLMSIFSPLIIIIGMSNVLGLQYLLPLKRDSLYTIAITSGAFLNLLLNIILIPVLWSFGACIATISAEFLVTFLMIVFAKKDIKFTFILRNSWKYIVSGLIMFLIVYFTQLFFDSSVLWTFLLVGEGAAVYFLGLLILRDKFLFSFFGIIKQKLGGHR